ncbi:MAG: hypothetical protein FJ125_09000 [Deltaproteobacteria bacterium]|nr:hypothetical protein [Deltaproteobacteria bacterium]
MKRLVLLLSVISIGLLLAASPASAQLYSLSLNLQRVEKASEFTPNRLSFFTFGSYGYADFDIVFNASRATQRSGETASSLAPPLSQEVTYEASVMRLNQISPQVGVSYAISSKLLATFAIGVTMMELEERSNKIGRSWYNNQHMMLFDYELDPGLATSFGLMFQPISFADFTTSMGMRVYYTSAFHLERDTVDGVEVWQEDDSRTMKEARTRDISIHLLQAVAHAGLEWRPYRMFVSNNFGLLLSYGMSFGTMEKLYEIEHTLEGEKTHVMEQDLVEFSMHPANVLGVYYGWSFFFPYFGTLGIEGRALSSWQISASYEYLF